MTDDDEMMLEITDILIALRTEIARLKADNLLMAHALAGTTQDRNTMTAQECDAVDAAIKRAIG